MKTLLIISAFFILYSCGDRQVKTDKTIIVTNSRSLTKKNVLYPRGDRQVKTDENSIVTNSSSLTKDGKDSLIFMLTKQVLAIIKNKNYTKFSEHIHPILGLRFSPCAFVDTKEDVIFTRYNFLDEIKTHKKFDWGSYDGSGDIISLTIEEYFLQFVYDADFLNAEKISLNKMISGGNTVNNLENVYKNCHFSESYFSGFDKKTEEIEGTGWCCIRLVFKEHLDKFYLVGIIHSNWTM